MCETERAMTIDEYKALRSASRDARVATVHANAKSHARRHNLIRTICSCIIASSTITAITLLVLGVIHL